MRPIHLPASAEALAGAWLALGFPLLTACPPAGDCPEPEARYRDSDGDGFGDPAEVLDSCAAGDFSLSSDDCDDDRASVHPEAEEVCGDGLDNDCDGAAWGCGLSGSVDIGQAASVTVVGPHPDASFGGNLGTGDLSQIGRLGVVVGPIFTWAESDAFWFADPLEAAQSGRQGAGGGGNGGIGGGIVIVVVMVTRPSGSTTSVRRADAITVRPA